MFTSDFCIKLVEVLHQTCGTTASNLWNYCIKLVELLHQTCGTTASNLWNYLSFQLM